MRVLCTCLPGHGHFNPMVSLARALVAAGHQVAFATAAAFCPTVEATGFQAFPAGISLPDQLEEGRRRYPEEDSLVGRERFENFVPKMLAGVAAPPRAEDLMALGERWQPDLLVHDETEFAGPIAATVAGIPYADQSVGIMRPLAMAGLTARTLAPLWKRWGVELGPHGGLFSYLYLDVCPPSLQSDEIELVDVAHPVQNAVIDPPAGERLPGWLTDLAPAPTAYVSLGTVFNQNFDVFRAILEGVGDLDLNVIVTIGSDNDPAVLGPQPANVHVGRYISQELVLPLCDVVVNQGGTAILPILAHGLPVLVLPQGANQFHNADACVAAGVGRRLLPPDVSAPSVRAEIRTLLDVPSYRQSARGVAREIEAMPGPEEGVRLLEQLDLERRPLLQAGVAPLPEP